MEGRADRLDRFSDTGHLVAEIVEHNDISRLQRGTQELLDIGKKDLAVHRPIGKHRCGQFPVPQGGHEGRRFPVAERRGSDTAPTLGSTSIVPRHVGRDPCFIKKHEPFQLPPWRRLSPCAPRSLHVLALLLAGVQSFF